MKTTGHIKPKFFLWTKLLENLLLAKYLKSVAAALTHCVSDRAFHALSHWFKDRLNNYYLGITLIKLHVCITILTQEDDVIIALFVPTSYKMQIKHNHESNYVVWKAAIGGKFKSNMLLEFICTDKPKWSSAVVCCLSLMRNFSQLSLNSGSAQVQTLLAKCRRFATVINVGKKAKRSSLVIYFSFYYESNMY